MNTNHLAQLGRLRWAVRATLALGIAASVAANILHANPNPISQTISAWPPLALLLTVELVSRIPMHKRGLAALRVLSTGAIAGIAAWVSYWHMQGVAARYGEVGVSAFLLPVTVDGLIVVASVSLVELAGRIRTMEAASVPAAEAAPAVHASATVQPSAQPAIAAPAVTAPATAAVRPAKSQARARVAAVLAEKPDAITAVIAEAAKVSPRTVRRVKAAKPTD